VTQSDPTHGGDLTSKIFASPDLSVFQIDLLSDVFVTPVKT